MFRIQHTERGMSLVDILVGISIMMIVFLALFSAFSATVDLGARNRLRATALLLANAHLEMIRALPYESVGTVLGLPPGTIPQSETITEDGVSYTRRTFIQYVDDPADGLDAADTLTADYKRIKVELSYTYQGETQAFSLTTSVAPKSQESLAGAGVLRIIVTDAVNTPLGSASIHIVNNTVATSVDITTFTNASGTVSFPGAWAGPGYEITVTKPGYSSAQTYDTTVANPSPSPSSATVAEQSTTEIYFKIDLLSTLGIFARAWPVRNRYLDDFVDGTGLASTTDTQVTGGSLTLLGSPGTYSPSGTSTSITISPADLGQWLMMSATTDMPPGTSIRYHILHDGGGGVYDLVPESDLPGNLAGLTASPIDLTGLSVVTYPDLRVQAILETADGNVSPAIEEWKVSYLETEVPVANAPFTITGSKTIGTDTVGNPIYKYTQSVQTDTDGMWGSASMEWDQYTLDIPGYIVAEACPTLPLILDPDDDHAQTLTLSVSTAHTLTLQINDSFGATVPNAEVRIQGSTDDTTRASGPCGVAYFPALTEETYTVSVLAPGLQPQSVPVAVSGATTATVTLTP
jgi:type II secretory pathway pseudopilin PulG